MRIKSPSNYFSNQKSSLATSNYNYLQAVLWSACCRFWKSRKAYCAFRRESQTRGLQSPFHGPTETFIILVLFHLIRIYSRSWNITSWVLMNLLCCGTSVLRALYWQAKVMECFSRYLNQCILTLRVHCDRQRRINGEGNVLATPILVKIQVTFQLWTHNKKLDDIVWQSTLTHFLFCVTN